MTAWINAMRRWLGRPEIPLATSGETSILFVLQSHSPKTLAEISEATNISEVQLVPILERLERRGRIRHTFYHLRKLYWAITDP
jgi:DNA-binding MarR family transcriptional regulator